VSTDNKLPAPNWEMQNIADDIVATIPYISPTVLQRQQYEQAYAASLKTNKDFRFKVLMLAGLYIDDTMKWEPTLEKDAMIRLVANDFLWLACWLVRSLKRREGDEISPARTALVAYGMAEQLLKMPWAEEAHSAANMVTSDSGSLREELDRLLETPVSGPYVNIVFDDGPARGARR
jgi:hypothetical protein